MLYNGGIYRALLVGHIMMVIIGFGAVFLGGVYGNLAKKRQGREGQAIAEAAYHVAGEVGEKFIMAVPVFGVLLVLASHKAAKFSQTWVWLALILFAIAFGVAQAVHMPNLRRMNALMGELNAMQPAPAGPGAMAGPPPQVLELLARGKQAAIVGAFLNVMVIVLVVLMVWKPGL